jgi:hypothetical protein
MADERTLEHRTFRIAALAVLAAVGLARLGLSLSGVPDSAVRWVSMNAVGGTAAFAWGVVAPGSALPHDGRGGALPVPPDGFYPVADAILGASLGALVGAISGARSGERWKEVHLDRLRVGIAPMRHGVAFRVSISM